MPNIDPVERLCRLHTRLNESDINKVKSVAGNLQFIADLNQANVFIDCPTPESSHTIVVAEAEPSTGISLYEFPVIGQFAYEAFEPAVFYTLRTGKQKFLNRALTQEGKMAEQSVVPIRGEHNQVIAVLIMEKDISDKVEKEDKMKALSEATTTLSEIMISMAQNEQIVPEVIEEALFIIGSDYRINYFNPSAINLVDEICNSDCKVGSSIIQYFPFMEEILQLPEALLMREIQIGNRFLQLKKITLNNENESNIFVILKDLTELKEKERELVVKSVAIREVHHRVKNNLQTIASLIRLQMRNGVPEQSKILFQETLNRILSIASVYEVILSESSTDNVDVYALIERIGNMIVYSENHSNKAILIEYRGSKLKLVSNKAISVALIINELVQNCMNHAFTGRDTGNIKVSFRQLNNIIELNVRDDGIGYSRDCGASFGLDIVNMMVEYDLEGEFTIEPTQEGTLATVTFQQERSVQIEKSYHGC